jgi:Bacterial membrane protein YfhO
MNDPVSFKRDALPLFALIAMVLAFTHAMILEGRLPFFRDMGVFFYPMRFSLAQSLQNGELPLWNRQIGMGFPLLANLQSESLYLPHLLFLILPFWSTLSAIFVVHYMIAAAGSYFLCRNWGYSPSLSMIGSILFTLGGTMVSLSNLMNHFQAAVWLPWVILFWEKYLRQQCWKNFLILTAALSLQFLAGSPEIYLTTLALALLDALRWRSLEAGPSWGKIVFSILAANAVLAGVAMVQILPTLELIRESRREFPIPFQLVTKWSLNPWQLINLFFLDREVMPERLSGMEVLFGPVLPFFVSYYVGAVAFLGLALWLYYSAARERIVVLAVMTFSLALAFGAYTPVFKLFFDIVPGFRMIRYPEKFFFVAYVLILFAALRGIRLFLESAPSRRKKAVILLLSLCGVLASSYIFFQFNTPLVGRFISAHFGTALLSDSTVSKTTLMLLSLERQVVLLLAFALLLILMATRRIRPWLFQLLCVAAAFFDLYSAHQPYQFLFKPDVVRERPTTIESSTADVSRLFYYPAPGNLHPSHFSFLAKPTLAEFNSLVFNNLLPNTGLFHGLEYMQEFDALIRWPYNYFLHVGNRLPFEKVITLLGSLNVRYLVSFRPLPDHNNLKLIKYLEQYPSWHYRLDRIVPRTYIVARVKEEKNPVNILTQLADGQFDPLTSVMLDDAVVLPESDHFSGKATITSYENQSVTIQASLTNPGILVLADSYYPGWKAYRDGQEIKIYRANLFFRAVALPAGDHRVNFRYEPASFKIGLVVSAVTIALLILISIILGVRGRKADDSFSA